MQVYAMYVHIQSDVIINGSTMRQRARFVVHQFLGDNLISWAKIAELI